MIEIGKHVGMLIIGLLIGILTFRIPNTLDPEIASLFGNVIIFVPFLFAFAQFDRMRETWQLRVITFGTSFLFGVYASIMWNLPSVKGPIMWILYVVAYAMSLAVWTSGHQSRGFRADMAAQFGSLPPYTRRLLGFLTLHRLHTMADKITQAVLQYRTHTIDWKEIEAIVTAEAKDKRHRELLLELIESAREEAEDWHHRLESSDGEEPAHKRPLKKKIWR